MDNVCNRRLFSIPSIAGGIVHQIRREKRTTISKVIVRGKRLNKIGIGLFSLWRVRLGYSGTRIYSGIYSGYSAPGSII